MTKDKLSSDAELRTEGIRSSDKGFSNIAWSDYRRLLYWAAKKCAEGVATKLSESLAELLFELGIDASMWRDPVRN